MSPDSKPTKGRTLLDFFNQFADLDSEFLVYDDGYRTWSYRYSQVTGAAGAFAGKLRAAGIVKGEKVILWSENRPEWLVAFWGCILEGVIVVPIDYRASPEVLHRIQEIVRPKVIIVGDDVRMAGSIPQEPPVWRLSELYPFKPQVAMGAAGISEHDVAEIVFTSGSTAAPKGVLITHRNLVADLDPVEREVLKYRKYVRPFLQVRLLCLLPLSHMFGQTLAIFFPPMVPAIVVFVRSYSPREILTQIRTQHVSFLICVPKMLDLFRNYVVRQFPEAAQVQSRQSSWLARRWRYRRLHRLFGWRFLGFVLGGASLEPGLEEFWSRMGFLVVQGYGLTETAPIVAFNHPFHLQPGSVGKPLSGVDVKLAGDGEILVRGDIVSPGYFEAPAESAEAFEGGWLHTGDIGRFDHKGNLYISGRKKEMIATPEGMKVFPEDVEAVLNIIPHVRDSAVVGPDHVHAVLVLEPGGDKNEVVRLANQRLEDHQKIRTVSVWTGGDLPRTEGTGKLQRAQIQRWVELGSVPVAARGGEELTQLIARYAPGRAIGPNTTLEELGLSSLDKVELMVDLEHHFNAAIDEAAFAEIDRVSDLAGLISTRAARALKPEPVITWNRTFPARAVRRVALPLVVLPFTHLCVSLTVKHLEVLESLEGPVIFASNHQSHLDTPVILAALPPRWRYRIAPAMWKEFFDSHFHPEAHSRLRWLTNSFNYHAATLLFTGFPLSQREAGLRGTLRHIGQLVSEGWSILIFPEGARTELGEIKPFAPGVAMIATRLRIPVVPLRLRGLEQVLPRSARMVHPGPASVVFGAPLNLRGEDYDALASEVEKAVLAL